MTDNSFNSKRIVPDLIVTTIDSQLETVQQMIESLSVQVDLQESVDIASKKTTLGTPPSDVTTLMAAAQRGHIHLLKNFLLKGVDTNSQDREGNTALIHAVMNNHFACMKFLMVHGANPNLYSNNGWTALYIAANRGFTDMVKGLIDTRGVRISADEQASSTEVDIDLITQNTVGGNALMAASKQGHLEIVEFLIERGADVNAKDNNNQTALMKAADKGHAPVVAHLIKSGADVAHKDNSGHTPLHLAAKANMTQAAEVLISSNAALVIINEQDTNQRTALFYAAQNGHLEMVKLLMQHGADPAIPDKEKRTACSVSKDPTGQIQDALDADASYLEGLIPTDAPPVRSDLTGPKRQKTRDTRGDDTIPVPRALALPIRVPSTADLPPHPVLVPTTIRVQRKRARSEASEDEKHARAAELNIMYTASWCGKRWDFHHLCAAGDEPLAMGYKALLLLFTQQFYDVEEGSRLALLFLQLASLDNPHAQFVFAVLQYHGFSAMAKNVPSSVFLLFSLSFQGHANAQCVLARHCADTAKGFLHPEEQSRRWYTSAAENDHPEALFRLGQLALSDEDIAENEESAAVQLLQQAVASGHPAALQLLGDCLRRGVGVPQNEKHAFLIYQIAAGKNDVYGSFSLAECYKYEVGTSGNPVEEAKFYMKAADQGHTEACLYTGMNKFNGVKLSNGTDFFEKDYSAAFLYLQQATLTSDSVKAAEAEYALGVMTMHGLGTEQNVDRAVNYLTDSSAKGNILAQIDLACHLAVTVNTEVSWDDAQSLLVEITRQVADLPLPVLSRLHQPEGAVHLRYLVGDLDAGYSFRQEVDPPTYEEFVDAAFVPSAQWMQEVAPCLKSAYCCWPCMEMSRTIPPHSTSTCSRACFGRPLARPLLSARRRKRSTWLSFHCVTLKTLNRSMSRRTEIELKIFTERCGIRVLCVCVFIIYSVHIYLFLSFRF